VGYQGSSLKPNPKSLIPKCSERRAAHGTAPVRLWQKAVFLGYKGGKKNTYHHTALVRVQGVNTKEDTPYYLGKRVCYIYKGNKPDRQGSRFRVIWGRLMRSHGNSGAFRAKFKRNLPPKAIGKGLRVMLYPSRNSPDVQEE